VFKNIGVIMEGLMVKYSREEIELLLEAGSKKKIQKDIGLEKLLGVKKHLKIFAGLNDDDIGYVLKDIKFNRFKDGEKIISQGDVTNDIFYILMGECCVVANGTKIAELKQSQLFGEIAAILERPRNADIFASKPNTTTISFKINDDAMNTYEHAFLMLYRNISRDLALKLEELNKRFL